jgi:hypothetical protein
MHKGERPPTTLPKYLEKAHIEVMKNYNNLLAAFKKMEPKARVLRKQIKRMEQNRLQKASKQGHIFGGHGPWLQVPPPDIGPYQMAYAFSMQSYVNNMYVNNMHVNIGEKFRYPMILNIDAEWISPGSTIAIYGCNFDEAPKVFFQISSDEVVQLEIQQWNSTLILASLNYLIGYAPLREFIGWIWIESTVSGEQRKSIAKPLCYSPWNAEYLGSWNKEIQGYSMGASDDGTCFKDVTLNDQDFWIWVTKAHSGDGHSELVCPMAGNQDMAQGWHIGVSGFGHASMTIWYHLKGPANVTPPQVSGIDWVLQAIYV